VAEQLAPAEKSQTRTTVVIGSVVALVAVLAALGGWRVIATQQANATATAQYLADYGPCGLILVADAGEDLSAVAQRWDDAVDVAGATPRMALGAQVATLQEVRRDTQALEVPECLNKARTYLVRSMDAAIEGFIAFLAQESDASVGKHFDTADSAMESFGDELARVRACAPDCSGE
jgi:hypothetical protein